MSGKTPTIAILAIIFAVIFPIVGLILGIIALIKINKDPERTGRTLAIIAIIISILFIVISFLVLLGSLAYFGVLSPQNLLPERTTFTAPIMSLDNAMIKTDGTIEIPFRNNVGVPIKIQNTGAGTGNCAGDNIPLTITRNNQVISSTDEILNGENFLVTWRCKQGRAGDEFKAELRFEYENTDIERIRTHVGNVMGKYR